MQYILIVTPLSATFTDPPILLNPHLFFLSLKSKQTSKTKTNKIKAKLIRTEQKISRKTTRNTHCQSQKPSKNTQLETIIYRQQTLGEEENAQTKHYGACFMLAIYCW